MLKTISPILSIFFLTLALYGCGDDGGLNNLVDGFDPLPTAAGYAVINSEFGGSTAISILDVEGELLASNWLTSGTVEPNLVAALSTDIAMPSIPEDGALMIVDRANGVLTRIDPDVAEVTGQLVVGQNPGDVAFVDSTHAWVTRRETDPVDDEVGGDLLEFDPQTMKLTGRRIDLFAARDAATMAEPKPLRAMVVDDLLMVGLDRLTADDFSGGAEGWLAVVDPQDPTLEVEFIPIPPLKNCGGVNAVQNETKVIVTCNGIPFNDPASSGIALVDIGENITDVVVEQTWVVGDESDNPIALQLTTPLGQTMVLAAEANSDFTMYAYYTIDLADGTVTQVFDAPPQFGKIAFDSTSGLLLVPADAEGMRRYSYEGGVFTLLETLSFGAGALPTFGVWAL